MFPHLLVCFLLQTGFPLRASSGVASSGVASSGVASPGVASSGVASSGVDSALCARKDTTDITDVFNTLMDVYDAYQTAAVTAADKKMPTLSLREANKVFEKKGEYFLPRCFKGRVPTSGVYDGDTFTMIAHCAPDTSKSYKWRVRLRGIDCPEMNGRTKKERRWAIAAREHVVSLIEGEVVTLDKIGYDKYGRVLANVSRDGKDVAASLLKAKLAVKYDGRTKAKIDWNEVCSKGKKLDKKVELLVKQYEEKRSKQGGLKAKSTTKRKKEVDGGGGFWGMFF